MKFDVLVCIDCWGNLPDVIAKNILDVDIKDKILVNSTGKNIHNDLQHLELNNDIKQFVKKYGQIKSVENRIANVLLAGQGWPCGMHNELIGIKSLTLFVPNRLKIFVDTKLIALCKINCVCYNFGYGFLKTSKLDRTCTNEHVLSDPEFRWSWVKDTIFELEGRKM